VKDKATGKWKTKLLAQVRVLDNKGILRERRRAFEASEEAEAKAWQAQERLEIKAGDFGNNLKRDRLLGGTELYKLIHSYIQKLAFAKERQLRKDPIEKGSNNIGMLQDFIKREPALCNKVIGELDKSDFDDYRRRRVSAGREDSTINRELSPVRKMLQLAKDGELEGEFRGVYFHLDPSMIRFVKEDNVRERWLETLDDDRQIYDAIDQQCRTALLKRRWLTFVVLASLQDCVEA
jgi:hypothetical protein